MICLDLMMEKLKNNINFCLFSIILKHSQVSFNALFDVTGRYQMKLDYFYDQLKMLKKWSWQILIFKWKTNWFLSCGVGIARFLSVWQIFCFVKVEPIMAAWKEKKFKTFDQGYNSQWETGRRKPFSYYDWNGIWTF